MRKSVFVFLAIALALGSVIVAIPIAATDVASAHVGGWVINSNWASVTPTIDGILSPGEWDDAAAYTYLNATGYVKNDGTNLYGAAVVPDPTLNVGYESVEIYFDNLHDGNLTAGDEDAKVLLVDYSVCFRDLYWDGSRWIGAYDTTAHGSGAWTHDGSQYTFELAMPLNSGDPQDLTASPGDTVGLLAVFFELTNWVWIYWPPAGNEFDANTYGDLVLASGPTPTPTQPPPSGGGGGGGFCFIATAAYGTPMAEELEVLRQFRDEYMVTNPVGSALVSAYYELSPPVAEFIDDHPALKPIVRVGLLPAVGLSEVAVSTTSTQKAAIVGSLALVSFALAMWARKRRA